MKTWAEMTERERDVLVAQALGWEVIDACIGRKPDGDYAMLPFFSTDRAAAMTLLDEFDDWILKKIKHTEEQTLFICNLPVDGMNKNGVDETREYPEDDFEGYTAFFRRCGTTEAEAICRAFLRAKGINIE